MKISVNHQYFTKQLLKWNSDQNKRLMPWKGEKDPYKIWLSEIILQQTRVEQGLDYYNRFIAAFPNIHLLAKAPETTVFKLWEGLGYYTRCKNLIATAKYISNDLKGKFPDTYEEILALKGVGPYTAAAIGSFAFNLPRAVVDGNVFRVLSRYFGNAMPIDSNDGKKIFTSLANVLLDKKNPAAYNQALMDFGATICKPQQPVCVTCVLKNKCIALQNRFVNQLPVKEKSITKKTRWFYYVVAEYKATILVSKRGAKDIWENLYEFILIENNKPLPIEKVKDWEQLTNITGKIVFDIEHISGNSKQLLTHQTIYGQFIKIKLKKPLNIKGFEKVDKKALELLPFPKLISNYLKDKAVSLNLF